MCSLKLLLAVFGCFLLVLPRCLGGQQGVSGSTYPRDQPNQGVLAISSTYQRDQENKGASTIQETQGFPTRSSAYQRDQGNQGSSNQFSYKNQGSSNKDGVHELENRSELEYNSTTWEDIEDPSSVQTSLHRARCRGHCIVYQHCDYGGDVYCFEHGEKYSDLNQWDNRISSIKMRNGCRLDVWSLHSYSGSTAKTHQDISCLEGDWNDVISSIKCSCG